jgi:hypothetical protein
MDVRGAVALFAVESRPFFATSYVLYYRDNRVEEQGGGRKERHDFDRNAIARSGSMRLETEGSEC